MTTVLRPIKRRGASQIRPPSPKIVKIAGGVLPILRAIGPGRRAGFVEQVQPSQLLPIRLRWMPSIPVLATSWKRPGVAKWVKAPQLLAAIHPLAPWIRSLIPTNRRPSLALIGRRPFAQNVLPIVFPAPILVRTSWPLRPTAAPIIQTRPMRGTRRAVPPVALAIPARWPIQGRIVQTQLMPVNLRFIPSAIRVPSRRPVPGRVVQARPASLVGYSRLRNPAIVIGRQTPRGRAGFVALIRPCRAANVSPIVTPDPVLVATLALRRPGRALWTRLVAPPRGATRPALVVAPTARRSGFSRFIGPRPYVTPTPAPVFSVLPVRMRTRLDQRPGRVIVTHTSPTPTHRIANILARPGAVPARRGLVVWARPLPTLKLIPLRSLIISRSAVSSRPGRIIFSRQLVAPILAPRVAGTIVARSLTSTGLMARSGVVVVRPLGMTPAIVRGVNVARSPAKVVRGFAITPRPATRNPASTRPVGVMGVLARQSGGWVRVAAPALPSASGQRVPLLASSIRSRPQKSAGAFARVLFPRLRSVANYLGTGRFKFRVSPVTAFAFPWRAAPLAPYFYAGFKRGEDVPLDFLASPVTTTAGYTIAFTMYTTPGGTVVLAKVPYYLDGVNDPVVGKFRVMFNAADTAGLAPGSYYAEVMRTDLGSATLMASGAVDLK